MPKRLNFFQVATRWMQRKPDSLVCGRSAGRAKARGLISTTYNGLVIPRRFPVLSQPLSTQQKEHNNKEMNKRKQPSQERLEKDQQAR